MTDRRYLQYGCGWTAPEGWRNFDASPTLRFERLPVLGRLYTRNQKRFPNNVEYGDIVKGLPLESATCDGVYCSHVLEHLALEDCRAALRNTFILLRPGGIFRLVLPDLEHSVRRYVGNTSSDAALTFIKDTGLGRERRTHGLMGLLSAWLGNSRHHWMWDYKAMEVELRKAGFVEIRRATIGDSPDPKFRDVETTGRWENCLGVEARKPA